MSLEYGIYERNRFQQPGGDQTAARVANEIFNHQLQNAAYDTRTVLQGRSSREADMFVNQVNQDLQRMAGQFGTRPDSYLATRHYNGQNGQPGELVSLTDGRHSKGVVAVRGDNLSYDNDIYNSRRAGFDARPGFDQFQSGDAVNRVANDIFSHRLQDAELDTRNYMRGRSPQDAERFTQDVNATLARIAGENGQEQERLANYLAIHRMRCRDGQERDVISITDGVDSKNIAAVAMYPYNRVSMNFDQSGQIPGQPYFSQQPLMQTAFDNDYAPVYPPGYAYGYGRHYAPRYYGAANPGFVIGAALSRIFRI